MATTEAIARATLCKVFEHATCLGCGCLCDDITVVVESGRVREARRACALGLSWFQEERRGDGDDEAWVDGRPVDRDTALDRAAEVLSRARAAVVLGLTRTATETVGLALAIADRIGALVDFGTADDQARIAATQRVGRVSATLGEVKGRADVVVFWGVDPVATHPRHAERYSVAPVGRFVPAGRAGRTVIVVDASETATARDADCFIPVAPDRQFETLWTLRALVKSITLDPLRVEKSTGVEFSTLNDLAGRLRRARYGAWFAGPGLGRARGGAATVAAALALVRDLNQATRFVFLTLGGPGNATGAEAVTTWQTGHPGGVDFGLGWPRSLPGATAAEARLARGEADAALVVGAEADLSEAVRAGLARVPRVVIGPGAERASGAAVALGSATVGIDAPGTVMRSDGVVLPLRPPLAARRPSERDWLTMLADRLRRGGATS